MSNSPATLKHNGLAVMRTQVLRSLNVRALGAEAWAPAGTTRLVAVAMPQFGCIAYATSDTGAAVMFHTTRAKTPAGMQRALNRLAHEVRADEWMFCLEQRMRNS